MLSWFDNMERVYGLFGNTYKYGIYGETRWYIDA